MTFRSIDTISDYCQNAFIKSSSSDILLVFLPAVNNKNIYPYYPRKSWGEELSKVYNVLYISDPYQPLPEYKDSMGSWFISPEGKSTLGMLAEKIEVFMREISAKNVVFYGSSMGGYAAIILSCLIENSKAISECPQLYMKEHPGSRFVCENILDKNTKINDIEPLSFFEKNSKYDLNIVCSIFDRHYEKHVIPFLEDIRNGSYENLKLETYLYSYPNYKKGHIALQKSEAFKLIDKVANTF